MFGLSFARIAPVVARALALVAVVAALVGVGVYLASRHYAPIVASLNRTIGQDAQALADQKAAYGVLAQQTEAQNAAIVGLQKAADQRAQAAASALAKANDVASQYQAKATALLASKPPASADLCVAARSLVDEQIKQERTK
ncbi:hypothetical protein WT88_29685 [Burkholderia stagnalis]|uniref:hypothetical protein n=1 Tax=Burkholderia stagnalis TaxID=1503054 RepID=UPI00075C16B3|nr:hypothetical protein [Burkholderia stagnalis]KVZ18654.1 hypothetical protein WT35_04625 [Burkholderia stagnalis]KWN32877.1 hypothetical protein WT86_18750 [Burkholderia stagnalis]KWN44704.1 hypothetical protein WT88_29685 [Burkholderia stagnalis]KWN54437.1 hypothetical protein WT87_03780 [Burkholderia stagnalis]KWO68844.1 hypothetical protein WT99_21150 [Burkholderia stagnalis]